MGRLENEKLSLEQMLKDLEGKLEEQGQTFQAQVLKPNTSLLNPTSDEFQGWGDTSSFERDQGRLVLRLRRYWPSMDGTFREAEVRAVGGGEALSGDGDLHLPQHLGGRGEKN